jgi:enamine deaminase RidA (YjgF/YER057c/UK114 family)
MRTVVRLPPSGEGSAGQLVLVGGMLFSSSITGADPQTGILSDKPERQVEAAFGNLVRLLSAAGASADELGLVTVCLTNKRHNEWIEKTWRGLFSRDGGPALSVQEYPLPIGQYVQLQVTGVPGRRRQQLDLPGLAEHTAPTGVRIGDMIFSSPIQGVDGSTGRLLDDPDGQVRQAFDNAEALVQQAGGSKDGIAHVLIFVRDLVDNEATLHAFLDAFPEDGNRPVRKNVYHDALKGTPVLAELQVVAVLGGGKRQNFEVPGFSKRHPNPAAAQVGRLIFSSGISGPHAGGSGAGEQAAVAFEHLQTALEHAGGTTGDIGLITIVVSDYEKEPAILQEWVRWFPDSPDQPARHVMAFGGRGAESYQAQLHMVAVLA